MIEMYVGLVIVFMLVVIIQGVNNPNVGDEGVSESITVLRVSTNSKYRTIKVVYINPKSEFEEVSEFVVGNKQDLEEAKRLARLKKPFQGRWKYRYEADQFGLLKRRVGLVIS